MIKKDRSNSRVVSVWLPRKLIIKIEDKIKEGNFTGKSDFIRFCIQFVMMVWRNEP